MNRRELFLIGAATILAANLPSVATAQTASGDSIIMMSARELAFAATTFNSDVTPTLHRTISHTTGRASAALSRFQVRLLRFKDPVNVEVDIIARNDNHRIVEIRGEDGSALLVYHRIGVSVWVVVEVFRVDLGRTIKIAALNGNPTDYTIKLKSTVKCAYDDRTEVYFDTRLGVSKVDGALAITFKDKLFTYA